MRCWRREVWSLPRFRPTWWMLKALGIANSPSVPAARRSTSLTWSTSRVGRAARAAMSGTSRRACLESYNRSHATIFPHVAFGSGPDDGGADFGAHGHATGHTRARGGHPETGGNESARSGAGGRGFGPASGDRAAVLQR